MAVDYYSRQQPANLTSIERLEQRIGRLLPAGYRAYLLQQDGGEFDDNDQGLDSAFGVDVDDDNNNFDDVLETYEGRVPTWLLPVARGMGGDLFAISLRDDDLGSLWFWDHELEEMDEDQPPTEDNLTRIADDWPSFVAALNPPAS